MKEDPRSNKTKKNGRHTVLVCDIIIMYSSSPRLLLFLSFSSGLSRDFSARPPTGKEEEEEEEFHSS